MWIDDINVLQKELHKLNLNILANESFVKHRNHKNADMFDVYSVCAVTGIDDENDRIKRQLDMLETNHGISISDRLKNIFIVKEQESR